MFKTLTNIFRIPELRSKVLFTIFMLMVYRAGYHVPIPGVDQENLAEKADPGKLELTRAENQLKAANQQLAAAEKGGNEQTISDARAAKVAAEGQQKVALANYQKRHEDADNSTAGRLASYVSIFSGGNLSQSTIFGLGIMPYISASIIFQLLTTVMPALEKLQKEGEAGRKKIQEWTRYATVPLCIVQAMMWLGYMRSEA